MHVFINFTNRQFWAARQFHWHEIRRRRKARAGKNFYPALAKQVCGAFPPTPFLFARPSVRFGAPQLRGRQFRSKNVRILSNKRTNNNT